MALYFRPHHVSLQVLDLDKSISFYHLIGFNEAFRYEDEELIIVHLLNQDFIIELFYNKHECDELRLGCSANNRIKHFSFKVVNIEETYDELVSLSVNVLCKVKFGRTKIKYFFIMDPDENKIEIVQDNRFNANEEGTY